LVSPAAQTLLRPRMAVSELPNVYSSPITKNGKMGPCPNSSLVSGSAPILQPALILHVLKVFAAVKVQQRRITAQEVRATITRREQVVASVKLREGNAELLVLSILPA
jgi:hypothetical protein